MAKAKITKRFVDTLVPNERPLLVYDTELTGFGIRLMPSGVGAYIIEYRPGAGGRNVDKKRMRIGGLGELAPDEARKIARETLAEVCKGNDPLADRQTKRREIKVHELIDQWDAENPPGRRSGKPMAAQTKSYTLGRLKNHVVPIIGSKRVSEINVSVVNDLLRRISKGETRKDAPSPKKRGRIKARGGEGAARKVASDLSIIMAYAVEKRIVSTNPVSGARKPKAGKRHSYLTPDQVQALGAALVTMEKEAISRSGIAIVRLLMLTGARPSELEKLMWSEVDLNERCLKLKATKTGYSRRPLSPHAIRILRSQPRAEDAMYVFPASRGKGHFTASKQIWNEARTRANLPGVVRYDARHMVATMALAAGHDIASVAAIMGHAGPRTTLAVYAHVIDQHSIKAADDVAARVATSLHTDTDDGETGARESAS
jgi:integrase